MINQFGGWFVGAGNILGTVVAVLVLAGMLYLLLRPYKDAAKRNEVMPIVSL